jgi:hypothetical protein
VRGQLCKSRNRSRDFNLHLRIYIGWHVASRLQFILELRPANDTARRWDESANILQTTARSQLLDSIPLALGHMYPHTSSAPFDRSHSSDMDRDRPMRRPESSSLLAVYSLQLMPRTPTSSASHHRSQKSNPFATPSPSSPLGTSSQTHGVRTTHTP